MGASLGEIGQLRAYIGASQELNNWINGARVFALLSGALDVGLLSALNSRSTLDQITADTGINRQLVLDLCLALEAHGLVERNGDGYQLAPNYALLAAPDAAIPLPNVIRQAQVMIRTLQSVASSEGSYTRLDSQEVLAMAEGAGISALSCAPRVSPTSIGRCMPEVESLWQAGAHHLEVGCGVGNSLLGIVLSYPKVTAVGIEIEEVTAAEAKRRADLLGIADRVELRWVDACELQDQACYDTIQWSQFFFPEPSRPVVLRAMRQALKPGGYLFMPWIGSISADTTPSRRAKLRMGLSALGSSLAASVPYFNDLLGDTPGRRQKERRFALLQRLLFNRWGVPVRTLGELKAEVEGSGFQVVRTMPTPANQFALTRGFLLAQREAG